MEGDGNGLKNDQNDGMEKGMDVSIIAEVIELTEQEIQNIRRPESTASIPNK